RASRAGPGGSAMASQPEGPRPSRELFSPLARPCEDEDTMMAGQQRTLTPAALPADTTPATVGEGAETTGPAGSMAFPSLDDAHEQRMEDMIARRLFPRQV